MTPNELADQLIAAGQSLIGVLDEESAALASARVSRVGELHEQKETAVASYETIMKALGQHPGFLDETSPATRQALMTMKESLDAASSRNINALRAALEMNRRVVKTIASSVNRQRVAASGYTKTGAAYSDGQTPSGAGSAPVSLNETF
jgi:flagellar biosynthesis/type III secretory pathway chaperone